jgi:hypothetical protein
VDAPVGLLYVPVVHHPARQRGRRCRKSGRLASERWRGALNVDRGDAYFASPLDGIPSFLLAMQYAVLERVVEDWGAGGTVGGLSRGRSPIRPRLPSIGNPAMDDADPVNALPEALSRGEAFECCPRRNPSIFPLLTPPPGSPVHRWKGPCTGHLAMHCGVVFRERGSSWSEE